MLPCSINRRKNTCHANTVIRTIGFYLDHLLNMSTHPWRAAAYNHIHNLDNEWEWKGPSKCSVPELLCLKMRLLSTISKYLYPMVIRLSGDSVLITNMFFKVVCVKLGVGVSVGVSVRYGMWGALQKHIIMQYKYSFIHRRLVCEWLHVLYHWCW